MRPATVHKIAKDIRMFRGLLGNRDKLVLGQEPGIDRSESFRETKFWQWLLTKGEAALASGEYRKTSPDWVYFEQSDDTVSVGRK